MRTPILMAAVLVCGTLSAAEIDGGLMTGLSVPVGDLHDKTNLGTNSLLGAHIGGHMDFNITPHHQVRGQLTFTGFHGRRWGSGIKNEIWNWSLGADWVYNFENPSTGWYTVLGASVNSMHEDIDTPFFSDSSRQNGRFGARGGGGFNFSPNFSVEGTLNQVFVDKNGSDGFGFDTASWVQVSAVFRFAR